MNFSNITVVLQGPLTLTGGDPRRPPLDQVVESIQRHLPGAPILLCTWGPAVIHGAEVLETLWLDDPGPLPALKTQPAVPNNVNRQIRSTSAGLARVKTPYALKMRTDCLLTGHAFVDLQRKFSMGRAEGVFTERVVVPSLYTLNPRVFERVPFHVSDWFQYGRTEDLLRLWTCAPMTTADATYFAHRAHRPGVRRLERRALARYAVEQYLFLSLVRRTHAVAIESIDDAPPAATALFERILARDLVVAAPEQLGFCFPKNAWASRSLFHRFNCYQYLDWLNLVARETGNHVPKLVARSFRRLTLGLVILVHRVLEPLLERVKIP